MDSQDCQQPAGGEPGPGSAPGGLRIGPCFAWAGSETAFPEPTSPASICTVEGVPGRAAPCLAVRVGPLIPAASSPELAGDSSWPARWTTRAGFEQWSSCPVWP